MQEQIYYTIQGAKQIKYYDLEEAKEVCEKQTEKRFNY